MERACSRGSGGIFPGEAGVADVGGFVVDGEYGVASVAGESADVAGWADAAKPARPSEDALRLTGNLTGNTACPASRAMPRVRRALLPVPPALLVMLAMPVTPAMVVMAVILVMSVPWCFGRCCRRRRARRDQ